MPRPRGAPKTALGVALISRRAQESLFRVADQTGLTYSTLSNLERGTHAPSLATALKLAKWLGWTVEQVVEAAGQPAPEDAA
jgi:DNA-binding XRE family transcriptional regulator